MGKVYLHAVVDTYSSFAFGFLHVSKKQPEAAVAVLHNEALPFYAERRDWGVENILTDDGQEFCGGEGHPYRIYLQLNEIEQHRTSKVRCPQKDGFVEHFNRTVLDEFFRKTFREKLYESVEALQRDLTRPPRIRSNYDERPEAPEGQKEDSLWGRTTAQNRSSANCARQRKQVGRWIKGAGGGQRELGISEATFHRWRRQYGGMSSREAKCLTRSSKEGERPPQETACQEGAGHRPHQGGQPGKPLSPARRRRAVEHLQQRFCVSERRGPTEQSGNLGPPSVMSLRRPPKT